MLINIWIFVFVLKKEKNLKKQLSCNLPVVKYLKYPCEGMIMEQYLL